MSFLAAKTGWGVFFCATPHPVKNGDQTKMARLSHSNLSDSIALTDNINTRNKIAGGTSDE